MELLDNSILIVAHPDDDILWFSSIVNKVDEILFCFSESPLNSNTGKARQQTIAEYPLNKVSSLNLTEPNSFGQANWKLPSITENGIALSRNPKFEKSYKKTFQDIVKNLDRKLVNVKNVFTHNPWGEYGHEEHILVYRAIKHLQEKHQFNIWYSNYCSNVSINLLFQYINGFNSDYITLPTNTDLANKIADIYKKNNCWTWYLDYSWFKEECLIRDYPIEKKLAYGHIFPINMLKIHINQEQNKEPGKSFLAKALNKSRKLLNSDK